MTNALPSLIESTVKEPECDCANVREGVDWRAEIGTGAGDCTGVGDAAGINDCVGVGESAGTKTGVGEITGITACVGKVVDWVESGLVEWLKQPDKTEDNKSIRPRKATVFLQTDADCFPLSQRTNPRRDNGFCIFLSPG